MNTNEILGRAEIEPLIPRDEIQARVAELGMEIGAHYEGLEVTAVAVLKGALPFFVDLCRTLPLPVRYDSLAVSSYEGGTESTGRLTVHSDLREPVRGRHVLLVEDIVDTGRTLKILRERLLGQQPASLRLVSLLDKPSRRVVELEADWTGFTIPDRFVVGYGLDYREYFRNLPDIGVLKGPPEIFAPTFV